MACKFRTVNCFFGEVHVQMAATRIGLCHIVVCLAAITAIVFTLFYQGKNEMPKLDVLSLFQIDDVYIDKRFRLSAGNCFVILLAVMMFSLFLIYGTTMKKPLCLLPFLFWQILEFVLYTALFLLLFPHMEDVRPGVRLELTKELYLDSFHALLIFLIVLVCLKIYAIVVIYRCFVCLLNEQQGIHSDDYIGLNNIGEDCMEQTLQHEINIPDFLDRNFDEISGYESYDEDALLNASTSKMF